MSINQENKLKRKVLAVFEGEDAISYKEFVAAFESVLKQVLAMEKNLMARDSKKMAEMEAMHEEMMDSLKNLKAEDVERMKTEMMKMMKNLMSAHDKKMGEMDAKMMEMHDGKDADEKMIIEKVLERIPKPKDGEPGKDIDPLTIEELQNELK